MTEQWWPDGTKTLPYVTSEWNPRRRHPILGYITPHNGIDLIGFRYVRASAAGVVTFARYNGGAGNEVRIRHADGSETRYKHLAKGLAVKVGDRVKARQIVGRMGTTGMSTGVHLHFETRLSPSSPSMNPRDFLAPRLTFAGGSSTPISSTIYEEDDDMQKPVAFERTDGATPEYMLCAPWLEGADEKQFGYIVTGDPGKGIAWLRMYARGSGSNGVKRNENGGYIDIQAASREIRTLWLAAAPVAEVREGLELSKLLTAVQAVPGETVGELKKRL